jgi:2-polyprenyl-6-methoxyphenol hydroxylase-like FAD-dependent oxidoreductase
MVRRGLRFESGRGLQVSRCSAAAFVVGADGRFSLRRRRSVHQRPRIEFGAMTETVVSPPFGTVDEKLGSDRRA